MPAREGLTISLVSAATFASLRTAASSRSGWRAARSDAGEVARTSGHPHDRRRLRAMPGSPPAWASWPQAGTRLPMTAVKITIFSFSCDQPGCREVVEIMPELPYLSYAARQLAGAGRLGHRAGQVLLPGPQEVTEQRPVMRLPKLPLQVHAAGGRVRHALPGVAGGPIGAVGVLTRLALSTISAGPRL